MYVPPAFAMSEPDLLDAMAQVRAADLVTSTVGGLVSSFLPVLFDPGVGEHGAFLGHLAKQNHHCDVEPVGESMLIAHGTDNYVSPTWYASKAENGRVVPTWNHLTLNVYGELVFHDDPDWLLDLVSCLSERFEGELASSWQVSDAPDKFVAGQLLAIRGIELRITRVEGKAKFSQNKPAADRAGVIEGLSAQGDRSAAAAAEAVARFARSD